MTQEEVFFQMGVDLFCIISPERTFVKLNPAWQRMIGYAPEELLGQPVRQFTHPDDFGSLIPGVSGGAESSDPHNSVTRFRCKDGTHKWLEWHHAITGEGGLMYAVARDITDRKKAESAMKASEAGLRESNTAKDKLLSIIAHDLRSPFQGILGISNLLLEQTSEDDGVGKMVRILNSATHNVYDMLLNLLEWAQSQTGRTTPDLTWFDLGQMIENVLTLTRSSAHQKSIFISGKIPPNTMVCADRSMIFTVIRNLICNAIKYSLPGGSVSIAAAEENRSLKISVRDTGVGLSADAKEKIFRIDQSYSTPGTNNERGSGLGLIICREFVEKHGGVINVETTAGKGSTFWFTLPLNDKTQMS